MSVRLTARVALIFLLPTGVAQAQTLLHPADYHHYIQTFEADEQLATGKIYNGEPSTPGQPPESAWPWMTREIPWFDSSDKSFEEMYYFRWYAWKKHLVHAPTGYIITEWLPKPNLPDFGALPDAAPFHLAEARWLHTRAIAEDDARFWYDPNLPGPDSEFIRKYSAPMATAVYDVTLANGDPALATSLLPQLVRVYHDWERTQQDPNGLFWSIDTRDAMEKSISGDGYRPTLNSYMVSDARAIAATALLAGNTATRRRIHRQSRPPQHPHRNRPLEPARPVLRGRLTRQRLRHPRPEAIHRPRHRPPVFRRPRAHRLRPVGLRLARARPRHRLASALRSPGLRRQVRRHHRRAPQPPLPLRLL